MFAETAGSGFVLDVLSTATSAISTIFTPLSTVHSLGAASTIFGAGKTAISANYLNTLSISHITQGIQSTYTTDMQKYIASLYTADQSKLDVYQERSKILSYHNECSLAAAEASISSALQPAGLPVPELTPLNYVVGTHKNDNTLTGLASNLADAINTAFKQAGITAKASGAVISLTMSQPYKLTVSVSLSPPNPTETASYVQGPPAQITLGGTPRNGDTITITGTLATPPPSGGGQTAPAAVAGAKPDTK